VLSDKSAYFQDTHAKIGLLPGWGLSQRLPRVVGPSTAKEISLTARRVPATEAASLGFVTRVVPDDALASAAREVAEGIAQWDPAHIARIKALMDDGYALPLSDALVLEVERAADLNRQVKIGGPGPA
jgi:enoyl-CoA hydratase|tara:strand:- start:2038 stop:2421 length:384 start_codon:yes stop_codon:yes gene_type:complete